MDAHPSCPLGVVVPAPTSLPPEMPTPAAFFTNEKVDRTIVFSATFVPLTGCRSVDEEGGLYSQWSQVTTRVLFPRWRLSTWSFHY